MQIIHKIIRPNRPVVTFIGTICAAMENLGGYRQIPLRIQEYGEFNVIAYYPSDSARFAELGRNLQQSSHLFVSGELLIRDKQRLYQI